MEALFWDDAWEQRVKWDEQEQILIIKDAMVSQWKNRVGHYWTQEEDHQKWCKWIPKEEWMGILVQEEEDGFWNDLNAMKIPINMKIDKIHWSWTTKGLFSIKEAYSLAANYQNLSKTKLWKRIWKKNLGPKVSIVFWLLTQARFSLGKTFENEVS